MRSWRRRPILLAEDDAATRDGLAELLTGLGYGVIPARNGQEGMDLLVGGLNPSLLIVDIGMPHLGGTELLKYVASDPVLRLVPVLIVTGSPERVGRAVADVVLTKPIDLVALVGHVRRLTSRARSKSRQATTGVDE